MNEFADERRRDRRHRSVEEHGIVSARIRPGDTATLVDVSAGGALIETNRRLLPQASVELRLDMEDQHIVMRGRVLRACVVGLRPACVCYRGAVRFDRHLPWFVEDSADGYQVLGAELRAGRPVRARATPQLA
jgi:hypothetical protein